MTHVIVRATAMRWADEHFPGWIEVDLADAEGRTHRIVEKVPVLAEADITATSTFPIELWIEAEFERMNGGSVLVRFAHGVETTDGLHLIGMDRQDVRWL
ncbi:hypothetical protein [Paenarthrobacter sp. JL.01a]|uniref:hypothetical protein n=1 Tax=Paenarthrobacter sp. JL.01a TaxID=2979324 RepID=UPI0021C9DFAB|nr:hypothetical protein [Paenarthrobacter sp. JL.01a]UXM91816.1 hypothetical protein N5P29_00405 [Paenarthrobacter sp. JL.01a]